MKVKKLLKKFVKRFWYGVLTILILAVIAGILFGVVKLVKLIANNWDAIKVYAFWVGIVVGAIIFIELLGGFVLSIIEKRARKKQTFQEEQESDSGQQVTQDEWSEQVLYNEERGHELYYENEDDEQDEEYYEEEGGYGVNGEYEEDLGF